MTPAEIRAMERAALLGEYAIPIGRIGLNIPPYVAIPEISILTSTPSAIRQVHPLVIKPFPTPDLNCGFVQICPTLNYVFLWLPPEDEHYRDVYGQFLDAYHGVKEPMTGFDVDHLFNRARAIAMRLKFVRMVLLGPGENRSHGASYEAARTKGGVGTEGLERGIDEVTLMKLCGVRSPRKGRPLTAAMQAHIARIAATFGIPPLEIERNIRELMEVAAFRPGDG